MEDKAQRLIGRIMLVLVVGQVVNALYLFVMSLTYLTRGIMHSPDTTIALKIWAVLLLAIGLCKLVSWVMRKG